MLEEEKSRLRRALRDSDVNRWHANLAERSELTADIYARRLDRFCEEFKTTPKALWSLDSKVAYNFLVDAVREYRNRKLTGSTIKGYLKPVISWLRENDIILTKSVNISGINKTPTLEDEKSPEPYELHSVWRFCDLRQAALIALEAFTGSRPQAFGNYKGNDGLRLSDLPELQVNKEAKRIVFSVMPTRVVVREEISKEGNQYETFLCEEGCMRLGSYLERRLQLGEVLRLDSAVIADDDGKGRALTTKSMYEIAKTPFRHAGLPWRPYILRRYADVRLGQAADVEVSLSIQPSLFAKAVVRFCIAFTWVTLIIIGSIEKVSSRFQSIRDNCFCLLEICSVSDPDAKKQFEVGFE
jgi:hypothetical protein